MQWNNFLGFLVLLTPFVVGQDEPLQVRFLLYPLRGSRNFAVPLRANDPVSLLNPLYHSNKPTKFLCHGYNSFTFLEFPQKMKDAYLSLSEPYNIIIIDWDVYSNQLLPYNETAAAIPRVGKAVAELMTSLVKAKRATIENFHFIGHSLGSQVGAFISRNLEGGQQIQRITGLDPAGPGFEGPPGLDPSDGAFVDVIRTSNGLGESQDTVPRDPVGTVDFYVNGGLHQPGCDDGIDEVADQLIDNLCSHLRAYKYYTESLFTKVGFVAYKCASYDDYKGSCVRQNPALMGEYVSHDISGSYYLGTNPSPPFAQG